MSNPSSSEKPCPTCKGLGRIPMAPWEKEVLSLIRISGKTPGYVADKLGITPQAANNRLKALFDAGLVSRTPHIVRGGGREYTYRKALPA